jgi:hypothetical protein
MRSPRRLVLIPMIVDGDFAILRRERTVPRSRRPEKLMEAPARRTRVVMESRRRTGAAGEEGRPTPNSKKEEQ